MLFDSDTGNGFGLSPIAVYLWKLLDGDHSIDAMLSALRRDATDVPEEAGGEILAFVEELSQHGLVICDGETFHDGREPMLSLATGITEHLRDGGREVGQLASGMLRYEKPRLEPLTLERTAWGDCVPGGSCCGGSHASSGCEPTGNSATASSGYTCHTTGNNASAGQWSCAIGNNATNGSSVTCTTGLTASGCNGCNYVCDQGNSNGTTSGNCSGFGGFAF